MNSSIFPIIEVKDNKLISLDGNCGYFYNLSTPDIEQLNLIERNCFYDGISSGLDSLNDNSYYKFYRLNNNSFLETNCNDRPNIPGLTIKPHGRPLDSFFGDSGIYSDIGFYDDYISFNGEYIRIVSVKEFSEEEVGENFLLDEIDFVLFLKKSSKDKSISKLERIRTGHLSSFLKNKRDIASEGTYQQAEDLLHDLMHGNESLFDMELFYIIREYSLDSLNQKTQEFHLEMLSRGVKTFIEGQSLIKAKSGLASLFNELIPGVKPKLSLRKLVNKTTHLRYLLPIGDSFLMKDGVSFHDFKDKEIYFDPFCENIKNRNMLVTGTSGAGKSVFVNKIVHKLIDKHPTVILDKGGSFKRLTLYHHGEVLSKGFNPFQFKDPLYLREIILSVVDCEKFGKLEKGKLLNLIKLLIPTVNSFKELLEALDTHFSGIIYYFEEIKDYISEDEITTDKILYVDIENYPKGIVAPLIIFLLEYFKQLPFNNKILVFDECWSFLKDHSSYIDECFRTFRKSGAFPIAISQALKDFSNFNKDVGSAITNNSYFKVYFPQQITEDNELESFDIENINSLRYEKGIFSECYLKTPDKKFQKILRNYLTPLELELFHTEAGQDDKLLNFIKQFRTYFNSMAETIESFVRLKHDKNKDDYIFFTSVSEDQR